MEVWKDVKGYEGIYQVSSLGRVKSLRFGKEKILKERISREGYLRVNLTKHGQQKTFKTYVLVAISFLNHTPCNHKIVVDHIDNNPLNNRVSNLQLITQRHNTSKDRKGSSKYTGVSWYKRTNKWQSKIVVNGSRIHLGYFTDEYSAHLAYQKALKNVEN